MKILFLITSVILISLLTSCASTRAGLAKQGSSLVVVTDEGVSLGTAEETSVRMQGEACNYGILGLVTFGDASVGKAMREGRIKNVYSVEKKITGINLGYIRFGYTCTVVYGN